MTDKEKELFLQEHIYKGLKNLNTGFDAPCIYYFSAEDFKILLERAKKLELLIYGIEPWKDNDYYDCLVCENYKMHASNPKWYNAAFTEFLNRNEEGLMYAASYGIKGFENEKEVKGSSKNKTITILKELEDLKTKLKNITKKQ